MKLIWSDQGLRIQLDGVSLELVRIPPGAFSMGASADEIGSRENERPKHDVTVRSFYLGKYPVTQLQWRTVMGELAGVDPEFRAEDNPMVNVWIEDALLFCNRLSQESSLAFRLPSEAEWEYACRAGTVTPYYWGDSINRKQVNFRNFEGREMGLKPAGFSGVTNAFGIYDMHGNVWEWCADTWHDEYTGAPVDGSAWMLDGDAGYHVQRGGSWRDGEIVCRSAFRVGDIAHNVDHIVGMRICLTTDQAFTL